MDYVILHLETRIEETKQAITKYNNAIKRDEGFILEFRETDPDVAQIYRGWKVFNEEKLEYFQKRVEDLQAQLKKRKSLLRLDHHSQ